MIRGTPDRTLIDVDRITATAAAALGTPAFEAAYRRGLESDREAVSEVTGVVLTANVPG